MKKVILILLLFPSFILFSCKDNNESFAPANALKRLTTTYDSETSSTLVKYDSQGRISKFEYFGEDLNSREGYAKISYNTDGGVKDIVEYDQDGEQIFKEIYNYSANQVTSISYVNEESWIEEGKYTIYYNLSGLPEKFEEFSMDYEGWYKTDSCTYNWEGDNLIQKKSYDINVYKKLNQNYSQKRSSKTKLFKSILNKVIGLNYKGMNRKVSEPYAVTNFEYDNAINPFWSLSVISVWEPVSFIVYSKNNATSSTIVYSDSYTSSITYTYEYNSNNYPTKVTFEEDEEYGMEIKFEYY